MDFLLTEDQDAIRALADRLFADCLPDDARLKVYGEDAAFDDASWQALVEAGLTALVVPEGAGGSALGLMDLAQVLEAQGAVCAPVPLLVQSLAVLGLRRFAPTHAALGAVAGGETMLTLAMPTYDFGRPQMPTLTGDALTGCAEAVPYGGLADAALVVADQSGTPALAYVSLDTVTRNPATLMSGEQAAQLMFDQTPCEIIAVGDDALTFMTDRAFALQGALTVGTCQEALRRTADYIGDRKQFGRAIASFQAVSQQVADAFMAIEALRSVMWKALSRLEDDQASAPAIAGATKY